MKKETVRVVGTTGTPLTHVFPHRTPPCRPQEEKQIKVKRVGRHVIRTMQ